MLLNARHHAVERGERPSVGLDPCSSAPRFEGWSVARTPNAGPWSASIVPATTWLLAVGWKRHGVVDPREVPGPRAH